MSAMSARGATTTTKAPALSEPDLQLGIAEIKDLVAVTRWVRHGKPAGDIETEVSNVISNLAYRGRYIKLQDRICAKYKIDEREFVRQLFQRMTGR